MEITPVKYEGGKLILIDQRILPEEYREVSYATYEEVVFAIKDMIVRGAPAIGATAAYGAVVAAKQFILEPKESFLNKLNSALEEINNSRPTAVNLMWAVKKMREVIALNRDKDNEEIYVALLKSADNIAKEDVLTNKAIGEYGNSLVKEGYTILTHCNAGALATVGYGTALGVIRSAHYAGKNIFVYADETRPRLQGARLTSWELVSEKIPCKLIADNAAATLLRDGKIDMIVVGADRIASNGDTANKIGTFMLSTVAKVYNVPFYIAAPVTTIDFNIQSGKEIVIEERDKEEITMVNGTMVAPKEVDVYNPAFDVTPNENITGIITEKGILRAPYKESINKLIKDIE